MDTPQHFTLKQVSDSIQKTISERYSRTYWVTAEMYKLNLTRKGHCYPELVQKEDDRIVVEMRGTLWKTNFDRIQQRFSEVVKEPLRDGLELLFHVKITYHPLYNIGLEILDIDPNYTLGALHRERQETLERLNKEGILNANQKLELALVPKRLAIISQGGSKGYSDFVSLLEGHPKKYHFNTFLFEATLQGDAAIDSIQQQLKRIEKVKHHFDAVVIIRGGGGEIGMHCYNNYQLAKAIATFPLPVFTGIGHSTNLTVCEMIAYRNGITPSDMAYFLLGIFEELDVELDEARLMLPSLVESFLQQQKNAFIQETKRFKQSVTLAQTKQKHAFQTLATEFHTETKSLLANKKNELQDHRKQLRTSFLTRITTERQQQMNSLHLLKVHTKNSSLPHFGKLALQLSKLKGASSSAIQQGNAKLQSMERNLQLIDPLQVLKRGYSIVTNEHGLLSEQNEPVVGQQLNIVSDKFEIKTEVKSTKNR